MKYKQITAAMALLLSSSWSTAHHSVAAVFSPENWAGTFVSGSDGTDGALDFSTPGTFDFDPAALGIDADGDNIKAISTFSRGSSQIMLFAALLSAVAAAMLMYNSIRTAVFARRREIEVMRLVGDTKWFIRVPFMLEGLLQGLIGAFLSIFSVWGLNRAFDNFFGGLDSFVFRDFALPNGQILGIGIALMIAGAILGAVGAGVAVTRYLDA